MKVSTSSTWGEEGADGVGQCWRRGEEARAVEVPQSTEPLRHVDVVSCTVAT